MPNPIGAVQAVKAVQSRQAASEWFLLAALLLEPDALWQYMALGDPDTRCEHCDQLDGNIYTGEDLRRSFPDLIFYDADNVYPNLHMTLWARDTCKCLITRL